MNSNPMPVYAGEPSQAAAGYVFQEPRLELGDYLGVLHRRKACLLVPALLLVLVFALIALLLPPVYKSSSTILIEEQKIPADFVMATVTSFAEQRLQIINQQIMSTTRLLGIIRRFDLYADLSHRLTTEEIIRKMREDVQLTPISADVVDRRTGKPFSACIAFTLSFEAAESPSRVQQVANVLASLFLEENLRVRERQTRETSAFLKDEMQKLEARLKDLEAELAAFKQAHIDELPELLPVHLQNLNHIERNQEQAAQSLKSLREREAYLVTQLAGTPEELADETQARLKVLYAQLAQLKTRFTEAYPDVIKTRAEIAELAQDREESWAGSKPAGNPSHVMLASQLAGVQSEIKSYQHQMRELEEKAERLRAHTQATPRVEQAYNTLLTERNNTRAKFDDLMRKYMEAKVAQGLEQDQKGERFTLIDPARLPEKPFKPNRPAIVVVGLVLGILLGLGITAVRELTDHSVRTADELTRLTGLPVLAGIPEMLTPKDKFRTRLRRILIAAGLVIGAVAVLAAVHIWVMDLDLLRIRVVRRIGIRF